MDISEMWNWRKPWFWIIATAILLFLAVAGWGIDKLYEINRIQHEQPFQTPIVLTTPTVFGGVSTATITPTVTATPLAPGNIYIVTSIEENGYRENGRVYDKAVFTNLNVPSLVIYAHCSAPSWPSPQIGHQFVLNSYGVLVPIEGIYSPLQRFFVIP